MRQARMAGNTHLKHWIIGSLIQEEAICQSAQGAASVQDLLQLGLPLIGLLPVVIFPHLLLLLLP